MKASAGTTDTILKTCLTEFYFLIKVNILLSIGRGLVLTYTAIFNLEGHRATGVLSDNTARAGLKFWKDAGDPAGLSYFWDVRGLNYFFSIKKKEYLTGFKNLNLWPTCASFNSSHFLFGFLPSLILLQSKTNKQKTKIANQKVRANQTWEEKQYCYFRILLGFSWFVSSFTSLHYFSTSVQLKE